MTYYIHPRDSWALFLYVLFCQGLDDDDVAQMYLAEVERYLTGAGGADLGRSK